MKKKSDPLKFDGDKNGKKKPQSMKIYCFHIILFVPGAFSAEYMYACVGIYWSKVENTSVDCRRVLR